MQFLVSSTNQQKRCPFPQSTAGAFSIGKLSVSDPVEFDPCLVSLTALSQPGIGHHLIAGLFSTKACGKKKEKKKKQNIAPHKIRFHPLYKTICIHNPPLKKQSQKLYGQSCSYKDRLLNTVLERE